MMDQKPNDRFDLRELSDTPREPLEGSSNPIEDILEITFRYKRAMSQWEDCQDT